MSLSNLNPVYDFFLQYRQALMVANNAISTLNQLNNALVALQANALYNTYASAADTTFINNLESYISQFISAVGNLPPVPN